MRTWANHHSAGERELAEILRKHGYDIERGGSLSYGETPNLVCLPGVHIEVKRSSAAEALEHSFQARMGEYRGIYERIGVNRFPVEERYGPATAQMMYSNDEITEEISAKVSEIFDKCIDQNILALLNS